MVWSFRWDGVLPAFDGHAVAVLRKARVLQRAVFSLAVDQAVLLDGDAGAWSIHRPGEDAPAGQMARSDHRLPEIPNLPKARPNIDDP